MCVEGHVAAVTKDGTFTPLLLFFFFFFNLHFLMDIVHILQLLQGFFSLLFR